MCGITGGLWTEPRWALDTATLARMTTALRHRGPDDEGHYESALRVQAGQGTRPGVALGHRRLSIIDLAGGHEPLSNEDGSVWVVFNGEIYNHRDLRRRLEGSGHRFRTACDTEVLVHLYEDEGPDFVEHLFGMFALALWDEPRGRLVLARDRLGKKPLVYRHEPGRLLFASELKSLLEVPGVPRELNPQALDEFLTYQYVPHPHSILQGFAKLPPAHLAVFKRERLAVRRYWQPDLRHEVRQSLAADCEALRDAMTDAVRLRLESDVPVGAFLSGGVDSSLVVGLMRQLSSAKLHTFSIGFKSPDFDESPFARQMAERLGTEHHELIVDQVEPELLERLAWHFDEPFADSSAIPTYLIAQLAKPHVSVALTGDGGDELFAGYSRYRATQLAALFDRCPGGLRRWLAARVGRLAARPGQHSRLRRAGRFAEALAEGPERRHFNWVSIFGETRRAALYADDFLATLPDADPFDFLVASFAHSRGRDDITRATLADLETYLPCDLLTKVDLSGMAHAVECRQPFLDHRVVELAAAMPSQRKLGYRGGGKRILTAAFPDLMPPERPKRGFAVPLDEWLRGPWRALARDLLLDRRSQQRGYFRPSAVEQLWSEHDSGRCDHGQRLWALIVFESWCRQWLDPQPSQ